MTDQRKRIFWSWQSDYSPNTCRNFIRESLVKAIDQVATDMNLEDAERPEIDHDTKGERGMADIVATILNKIADAAVFVADVTPIARSDGGKWLPNPNVMIELGWAMHRPGWERVIGICNMACGATVEDLPFDIRQRRVVTFVLADDADKKSREAVRSKLIDDLNHALMTNLQDHAEEIAAASVVSGVPAKSEDYSIWASARDTLTHIDAFGGVGRERVRIADIPRAYMRIVPAGWRNGMPLISEIANLESSKSVNSPFGGTVSGNFGACEEGFVRYGISSEMDDGVPTSTNMVMFFEQTGEYWILHGGAIGRDADGYMLKDRFMLGSWSEVLRRALGVMDHFQAQKVRRVEAGLFNVKELQWFAQWPSDRTFARRNDVREERQSQDWSDAAQLTFLTDAYNRVRNLFAQERATEADVVHILQQADPGRFRMEAE